MARTREWFHEKPKLLKKSCKRHRCVKHWDVSWIFLTVVVSISRSKAATPTPPGINGAIDCLSLFWPRWPGRVSDFMRNQSCWKRAARDIILIPGLLCSSMEHHLYIDTTYMFYILYYIYISMASIHLYIYIDIYIEQIYLYIIKIYIEICIDECMHLYLQNMCI